MHDVAGPRLLLMQRALRPAWAILVLTAVHHAYGAWIYGTPWRLHVAVVAGLTAAVLWATCRMRMRHDLPKSIALAVTMVFCVTDLIIPVTGIGLFEGGYNHLLKNVLYVVGASSQTMVRLFPPPAYELPNDLFFEGSGVAQFVVGMLAARRLFGLLRYEWRERAEGRGRS
jgi:hypothetical protein